MNEKNTHIPELLDYRSLTKHYGLPKSTMTKRVMNGTFCNVVKVGGKNYFRKADVENWIDSVTIEVAQHEE